MILGSNNPFVVEEKEKEYMKHFLGVAMELIWMTRNKIWKKNIPIDIVELSKTINANASKYWQISAGKKKHHDKNAVKCKSSEWAAPPRGEYKLNFDAAFKNNTTYTGVVLKNDCGAILGAWTNRFQSENTFCAEAEAAAQALKIATSLNLEKVTVQGNALNVILDLKGVADKEDWRAKLCIKFGRSVLNSKLFWFLNFIPGSGNVFAHRLARWASVSDFCGQVNLKTLPSLY